MWLEEAEELFKGYLPYYLLLILPVFMIISPINPVTAAYEFPVYRMQHYDLHGVSYGCRSAAVNHEARSISNWSTGRHCVVTMIQDLTIESFRDIRSKAGALLIVIPQDVSLLTPQERQRLMTLEEAMLTQETSIPVYFVKWTPDIKKVLHEITHNVGAEDKAKSAVEALLMSVAANGYQIVISPRSATPKSDIKVATLQGNLAGLPQNGKVQTIAVVTHYDSKGIAPDLAYGAESNASGVAMLLELVRLFSILYADPTMRGHYNIIFLLTGGGKFNFQGSKKWLEDQLDSLETSLIQLLIRNIYCFSEYENVVPFNGIERPVLLGNNISTCKCNASFEIKKLMYGSAFNNIKGKDYTNLYRSLQMSPLLILRIINIKDDVITRRHQLAGLKILLSKILDVETFKSKDASYVLCLDTMSVNSSIYMHVSKPPKEGSPAALYYSELQTLASHTNVTVETIHKKINLADDVLAWEHERFSIRRLPAFTLSSLKNHRDLIKTTIFDTKKSVNLDKLVENTQLIAEALASHIYNLSGGEIFTETLTVERESLEAWLNFVSSEPRGAQLLCTKDNGVIYYLQSVFNKYLTDVRATYATPDKRDPDFMFYEVTDTIVNVYHVKPAVFDLILTVVIILYLGSIYMLIQNFTLFYGIACSITANKSKSS